MLSTLSKGLSYGSDNLLAIPPKALQLQAITEEKTENTGYSWGIAPVVSLAFYWLCVVEATECWLIVGCETAY